MKLTQYQQAYKNAASFVPQLTTKVLQFLSPQHDDVILDIGSGDGTLTAKIAPLCSRIVGLDASAPFTTTAESTVTPLHSNAVFFEYDCRDLSRLSPLREKLLQDNAYDKVFSNAALHWILREKHTRLPFFHEVYRLLRPGGRLAFEMGGAGNIAEVHTGLLSVLNLSFNVSMKRLQESNPWFFPTEQWLHQTLSEAGFDVDTVESEYRPTKLNADNADGSGGLEGWIKLMCAPFFDLLEPWQREGAARRVAEILNCVVTREENGERYLGYVRVRAVAHKPGASS